MGDTISTAGLSPANDIQSVEWAQIPTLDLALLRSNEGKQKLVKQLEDCMCEHGIFYITNHGIPSNEMDLQVAIAKEFFGLSLEEKMKFHSMRKFLAGCSEGYRPVSTNKDVTGVEDNIQIYMMTLPYEQIEEAHPTPITASIEAIRNLVKSCHEKVLHPLLHLIAIILELPDEYTLVQAHSVDKKSTSQFRYIHYSATRAANEKKIYVGAHTDLDVLTMHFPQPIAALQITGSESERVPAESPWQWVQPRQDAVLINVGDALASLSGGYFRAALHRVHRPPVGQDHVDRVGILYFSRSKDDLVLDPLTQSAKLQRLGLLDVVHSEIGRGTTMAQWVRRKQRHKQDSGEGNQDGTGQT
ncbi:Clavaminate synthase-like protein [Tothia fuscella]|uniref:Clavaminate synthase-like protein n=1 Tax=Tothia fuscella TaxID=1048955 RepID=A0A9P4NIN9_9PEZI|nr:Clavaminate synthase-like protein [Tothia fuscella]